MKKWYFKLRLLPVIFYTAFVLLIVKVTSTVAEVDYGPDMPVRKDQIVYDIFGHAKSSAILFVTIWAFLTLAFLLITGQIKIKKTAIYIPMAVYLLGVLVSFAMSEYPSIAWIGNGERAEGARVLLCYVFMLFYTIQVIDDIRDVLVVVSVTMIGVALACLIGLSQLFGHDFLLTPLMSRLIAGDLEIAGNFQPGQVYQTVENMNYVGMYLALILPILLVFIYKAVSHYKKHQPMFFGLFEKKILIALAAAGVLLIMILANVYGAKSVGGYLALLASAVILVILCLKKKNMQITALAVCFLAFIALFALIYVRGVDSSKQIDYFETKKDEVKTSIDGNPIDIIFNREDQALEVYDEEGQAIMLSFYDEQTGEYALVDDRFQDKIYIALLSVNDTPAVGLDVKNEKFVFLFREDGAKYRNSLNHEVSLTKPASIGFEGHLSAGSGRGYIWARTLPLLGDCLFKGKGPTTYVLYFPQNDYAGKYSTKTQLNMSFSKPHCMYLDMFFSTGGVSLLAFLVLVASFFYMLLREKNADPLLKALAAGVAGYLVAGIMNDSLISTMPMFYSFLGMGLGLLIKRPE